MSKADVRLLQHVTKLKLKLSRAETDVLRVAPLLIAKSRLAI